MCSSYPAAPIEGKNSSSFNTYCVDLHKMYHKKKSEFRGILTILMPIFFSFCFCLKNYITPTNQQLVVSYQHIALSPNVNYLIDISA